MDPNPNPNQTAENHPQPIAQGFLQRLRRTEIEGAGNEYVKQVRLNTCDIDGVATPSQLDGHCCVGGSQAEEIARCFAWSQGLVREEAKIAQEEEAR